MTASVSGLSAGKSAETASSGWPAASVCLSCGGIDVIGIKTELIVDLALLGIAEYLVRFGERLELFLGCFVSGINVRMILARKFAKRLANVLH